MIVLIPRMSPHPSANVRRALFAMILVGTLVLPMASQTARAAAPSLTILSPADGSVIANGSSVVVLFAVSDFSLVQPGRVGQVPTSNEGHVNAYVDSQYVRLLTQVEPFALSLSSGPHTIRLQLVADNGTALNPDVSASVSVVTTPGPSLGAPRIEIVAPAPLETTGHGIYLSLRITNFTLVEPRGQPNAPNEGHVQVLVRDNVVMELVQYEPILLVALPDGDVTIGARLVNNDNSVLNPDMSASVSIRVAASSSVSLPLVFNGGIALLLAFILVVLVLRRRKAAARDLKPRGGEP